MRTGSRADQRQDYGAHPAKRLRRFVAGRFISKHGGPGR
jgi:hypothetical protein